MKAQTGIEYMIIIGFVSLSVTLVLIAAYFYIGMSKDRIIVNQIESFSSKIINSAESVFFAGTPSQTTISVYIPKGINNIEMVGYDLIVTFSTSTGTMKRAFESRVFLEGNISKSEGLRKLVIKAEQDKVTVN